MAIIQIVQWDDSLNSNDVLAWRYVDKKNPAKSEELGNWTQLIVRENQEAILFRDGQALDLFRAGRHSLSTDNIPLLRRLINLPTGGESAFKSSVWFINKINLLDIKWGTQSPILLRDPEYQIPIYVRAYGQFGLTVKESRQFVLKLAGNKSSLNREDIENYFKGLILSRMGDMISTYIAHKKVNIFEINSYLEDMSNEAVEKIKPEFSNYGIEALNFYFGSVNVVEDESLKKLKDAMSERASMNVMGYNYQQKRSFDVMESAAKNEGGSNLLGAGVGLGAGMGMGGTFGQMAAQMGQFINPQQQNFSAPQPQTEKQNSGGMVCPSCGKNVMAGASFCMYCGARLACPKCGNALIPGAKFCPNCGTQIQ